MLFATKTMCNHRVACVLMAAASFSAACSRSPQQREARFMEQAQRLSQKKEYARAALQFRNAIQAMPTDPEPYYQLGLTYLASGNRALAAGCFRKATELNPKHALVTGLKSAHESRADDPGLADTAQLLYGMALLAEGGELAEPAAFVTLLSRRLAQTLG